MMSSHPSYQSKNHKGQEKCANLYSADLPWGSRFCFSTFQTAVSEALVFDHDISLWVYSRKPLYQQGTTSGVYYNKDHQDGLSQQLYRKPAVLLGGTMNKDTKEPSEKVLLRRMSATPTVAGFGEKGLNEIEENGDGGESRGGEQ